VEKYIYRATTPGTAYDGSWKPSIFMPRHASRITLEIVNVRVERVKEISIEDCHAEGFRERAHSDELDQIYDKVQFGLLWERLNAKRGYGWAENPWVWVLSFKRV
jgi:hypothetical protein